MILIIKSISSEKTWPLRHEVMWPNMPFDFIKLPEDPNGKHFGLFINDEIVSIVSVFQTENGVAQFRKLATKVDAQGKGYATKLILHLIKFVKEQGIKTLWCNARADKTDFYKKFGMLETDKTHIKQNLKFVILQKVL